MNFDGSDLRERVTGAARRPRFPSWSPNGDAIALLAAASADHGDRAIYVYHTQSGDDDKKGQDKKDPAANAHDGRGVGHTLEPISWLVVRGARGVEHRTSEWPRRRRGRRQPGRVRPFLPRKECSKCQRLAA